MLLAAKVHVTIAGELLLGLAHEGVEASLDVGQTLANMRHEGRVERLCEKLSPAARRDVAVGGVVLEKVRLSLQSLLHGLVALDILLGSINHANEAQLQRVDASRQNIKGVCAVVHEINLCEDANGSAAERVDMAGEFQGFRVDNVDVCGRDGENNAVGLGNVLGNESSGLLFNVGRLIANRDLLQLRLVRVI